MGSAKYEKYKEQMKLYYQKNRVNILAKRKLLYDPNKNRIYKKRYSLRLEKKGLSEKDIVRFSGNRLKALKRDDFKCQNCGMTNEEHIKKWKRSITVDHKDGSGRYSEVKNNALDNLVTLCLSCHGKKDCLRRKFRPIKIKPKGARLT